MSHPMRRKRGKSQPMKMWAANKDTGAEKDSTEVRAEKDRLIAEYLAKRGIKCTGTNTR